ncbi:telomere-associated protein RIF1 [Bombyx mori]|uniref:Telomere-associated protein RIF1 n=1 Tax=Bombyx mori TaxID=7091 RepID=A0A8R2GBD7_BOMMO|nr:telomere-associated protein RIF1 [Bombyx mori]XP_012549482.1 telomere-associated protein RIF1 [Bombyx mori]XP_021206476.1 telomere-associated protein RIF1 [Bombyx mori]XP_021206477.1 telomere-associated protein RIF1 [Bombyx mori]
MPEYDAALLKEVVCRLEDNSLENDKSRRQNYEILVKCLDDEVDVNISVVKKILNICEHDMKQNMKYTAFNLTIILKILERVKAGKLPQTLNFVSTALVILDVINATALLSKIEHIRTLCTETMIQFPDETLVKLAMCYTNKIMEFFEVSKYHKFPLESRILFFQIILKIIKVLPPEKKIEFVNEGLSVWLSKLIPTIVTYLNHDCSVSCMKCIELLELLTNEILRIDYTKDIYWECLYQNISNPSRYPLLMKKLLENGSSLWHRLWIVCIKLLGHQITRNVSGMGTPINSMLPVVEAAFKIDADNRCRAFQCWSVLIDTFAKETNDNCVNKRLKLLVIPLRLNNAKVEETALAKFETWWHLIVKFSTRLGVFTDVVLTSFLHFCFGKYNASGKPSFIPGQISDKLSMKCVDAFVEIVGHVGCEGCTDVPRLKERLLKKKYLIEHWHDWSYSLKTAINLLIKKGNEDSQKQMSCIWKSFLLTVGELPDNNIRTDLVNELLNHFENFVEESKSDQKKVELVFNSLVITLFDDETKISQLFNSQTEDDGILHRIISILVDPAFNSFYRHKNTTEMIQKLKPIAYFILEESINSKKLIFLKWVLDKLPSNDNTLKIWTALAELLCESDFNLCSTSLSYMVIWPLKSMNLFNDVKYSAKTWLTLYNTTLAKLKKTELDENISNIILYSNIVTQSSTYMSLCALLAILSNSLTKDAGSKYDQQVELVQVLVNRIDNYEDIEDIFPLLVDIIIGICNHVTESVNETLEEHAMTCVKKIMKLLIPILKQNSAVQNTNQILIGKLLKSVYTVLQTALYPKSHSILYDVLKQYAGCFNDKLILFDAVDSILKLNSTQDKENSPRDMNSDLENCESLKQMNKNEATNKKSCTPNAKEVTKKKKRESSIVNTVVENGEEFVVVKSNWKFNPKKLTENQKEKFTRKREDIPALYQDLSQSQDEFKLTKWKTDSQDTTTNSKSNSKSVNNFDNPEINLKEMPGTDVVPTIIENILGDKKGTTSGIEAELSPKSITTDKKREVPKSRTPRMALKDRIFHNVRNLIEKSITPEKRASTEDKNLENSVKTSTSTDVNIENLVNSAPSLLLSDRPSRVKRKPKKFDDAELFALKKRRHSQTDSQSDDQTVEKPMDNITTDLQMKKSSKITDTVKKNIEENNLSGIVLLIESTGDKYTENTEVAKLTPKVNNIEPSDSIETSDSIQSVTLHEGTKEQDIIEKEKITTKNFVATTEKVDSDNVSTGSQENTSEKRCAKITHVVQVHSTDEITTKSKESSARKSTNKKSRIEKELAIDMVEGHPFLNTPTTSQKRNTRKSLVTPTTNKTSLSEKLNKTKNSGKKDLKEGLKITQLKSTKTPDSQGESSQTDKSQSCSEDVIESSQDSTLTTVSVIKKTPKKIAIVSIEKIYVISKNDANVNRTKSLLKEPDIEIIEFSDEKINSDNNPVTVNESAADKTVESNITNIEPNSSNMMNDSQSIIINETPYSCHESKDDIELPVNKTVIEEKNKTESSDITNTESLAEKEISDDVVIINDDDVPITISSEEKSIQLESQELAEADTQPIEHNDEFNTSSNLNMPCGMEEEKSINQSNETEINTQDDATKTFTESMDVSVVVESTNDVSSPYKNDEQRKKDFLNNTVEISPIKILRPDLEDKSPSPETSRDYVVIKLTSPVHSNGEPFEKGSPEFFTEEKVSPDKRDQSPPRPEVVVNNTSPNSLQSLKKNKPQVRAGGRAAQMLGLCVPDNLNSIMKPDRSDYEESKKNNQSTTPARRNLRILYNSVGGGIETTMESEDSETFLRLKRTLPALDVSPSVPILKRKLAEISDEATVSPANKRKRVSFHDPPVSTTVSVQKYIEPIGLRSPQNSAQKRQERQTRPHSNFKSQKRLDSAFKLETALSKAVESFTDVEILNSSDNTQSSIETSLVNVTVDSNNDILSGIQPLKSLDEAQTPLKSQDTTEHLKSLTDMETDSDIISKDDTQISSLEQTPVVEVVKISDLNDTDPICPQLINCSDPIDNVAADLSSVTMKSLLIKELQGKVNTIGDLAKMTELEVNRLCIKAPKVKTAKNALYLYALRNAAMNKAANSEVKTDVTDDTRMIPETAKINIDTQTINVSINDVEIQTCDVSTSSVSLQTESATMVDTGIQTKESGEKSTADMVTFCLEKRSDFVDRLSEQLDGSSVQKLAEKMTIYNITETLTRKMTTGDTYAVLKKILEHSTEKNKNTELSILGDYLYEKFDSKDIILLCSQLLQRVHDKPN